MTKIRLITKLYSVYLFFLYEYSKCFGQPVVQPIVQLAATCKRTFKQRLVFVDVFTFLLFIVIHSFHTLTTKQLMKL